jgi:hypothetical protein
MSGRKLGAPKARKTPNPKLVYRHTFNVYYLTLFGDLDKKIADEIMDNAEMLPPALFDAKASGCDLYCNPTPKAISAVIDLLVVMHGHMIASIEHDDPALITALLRMPETINANLKAARSSCDSTLASFGASAFRAKQIKADLAFDAMDRLVKGLVEATFNCTIMGGHLTRKLVQLCIVAHVPEQVMRVAKSISAESKRRAPAKVVVPEAVAEDSESEYEDATCADVQ